MVIISLAPGFHWTADLLSTALAVEHGWQETFYFQLFLDLVNLFSVGLYYISLPHIFLLIIWSVGSFDLPCPDLQQAGAEQDTEEAVPGYSQCWCRGDTGERIQVDGYSTALLQMSVDQEQLSSSAREKEEDTAVWRVSSTSTWFMNMSLWFMIHSYVGKCKAGLRLLCTPICGYFISMQDKTYCAKRFLRNNNNLCAINNVTLRVNQHCF